MVLCRGGRDFFCGAWLCGGKGNPEAEVTLIEYADYECPACASYQPLLNQVQDEYPDVMFIILDGSPHNVIDWDTEETISGGDITDWDFTHSDNVLAIFYAEHETGFLAGYAAVQDGYTSLGFMGGKAVPAVVRFGFGFMQGANYAAEEMELATDAVSVSFNYLGGFGPDAAFQAKAAAWYQGGVEVIFAAAGGAGGSVMKAAEQENGKVIGVDINQSADSTTVITSAMKELAPSVYESLVLYFDGDFPGGTVAVYDAENLGVKLPSDFTRFTTFNEADYVAILADIVAGTVEVNGADDLTNAEMEAIVDSITVTWIE